VDSVTNVGGTNEFVRAVAGTIVIRCAISRHKDQNINTLRLIYHAYVKAIPSLPGDLANIGEGNAVALTSRKLSVRLAQS